MRQRNTTSLNQPFPPATIYQVWCKARIITGYSPNEWRYDTCGKPIRYSDHGNTSSLYGWEIDHIYPVAKGGLDKIENLQPLQWEGNRSKSDTYPWYCS